MLFVAAAKKLFLMKGVSRLILTWDYVRVVRVSCVCFLRILRKLYLKFIVYSRYPGNVMFAAVCVFNV